MTYIQKYSQLPTMPKIPDLEKKYQKFNEYLIKYRSKGIAARDLTMDEFAFAYTQEKAELKLAAKKTGKKYLSHENITRRVSLKARMYSGVKGRKEAAEKLNVSVEQLSEMAQTLTGVEAWEKITGGELSEVPPSMDPNSDEYKAWVDSWDEARERYNAFLLEDDKRENPPRRWNYQSDEDYQKAEKQFEDRKTQRANKRKARGGRR